MLVEERRGHRLKRMDGIVRITVGQTWNSKGLERHRKEVNMLGCVSGYGEVPSDGSYEQTIARGGG